MAALHAAVDDFTSIRPRRVLDAHYLIHQPYSFFSPYLPSLAARQFFSSFTEQGMDWDPCHGDVTLDNFHVTDDGQVLFG